MDDGWVQPLGKSLPSLVSNLWRNIVMDETSLGKWLLLQNCKQVIPQTIYKEWQKYDGLTFTVGNIVWRFTIIIEQDN